MSQPSSPAELAPSETTVEIPTLSRLAGMVGLFLVVAGVVSIIASGYGSTFFGESRGYLIVAIGFVGLLVHAARDNDQEIRRIYGLLAGGLLLAAVVLALYPLKGAVGALFLPWGAGAAFASLMFLLPFARHETEEPYRMIVEYVLLAAGGLAAIGAVVAGIVVPNFLVGPGLILALLGIGYLAAYLSLVDSTEGYGFYAAVALGALGGVALAFALGRAVVPTVLHDGPMALKTPLMAFDKWKVLARGVTVVACLGFAAFGFSKRVPLTLRGVFAVLGLAAAAVFVVGSFANPLKDAPSPYLVPHGLILGGIGLTFLCVSLAVCTDNQFIVLTRRELSAYFYSPIGYIVLIGMSGFTWLGYWLFLGLLFDPRSGTTPEPILQDYLPATFIGPLLVPFLVSALTMRLFSEEKRTGTLEVLLTAPVGEAAIVLSKFVGCWIFFMLTWVPAGLYLVALRVEGGQPFDYRPLLSFYLAVAVSGAAFISIGMFFSSLTKNQIVAAVMTFAVLLVLMVIRWNEFFPYIGAPVKSAISRMSYWLLWMQSLRGQLPLRDVLLQASVAVFGLYLTYKVLEARKWS